MKYLLLCLLACLSACGPHKAADDLPPYVSRYVADSETCSEFIKSMRLWQFIPDTQAQLASGRLWVNRNSYISMLTPECRDEVMALTP